MDSTADHTRKPNTFAKWTMPSAAPRTAAAVRTAAASPSRSPVLCVTRLLFWRAGATLRTEAKSNPSWRLIGGAAAPTLAAGGRRCFLVFFFASVRSLQKWTVTTRMAWKCRFCFVAARGLAPPTHVQKQKHLWTPGSIPEVKETTFPGGKCDLRPPPTHKSSRDLGPPHGTSKCRPRFNQMTRRRLTCSRRAISFALPHSSAAKLKHPMCEIVPPRQQIKPSVITSVNLVFK